MWSKILVICCLPASLVISLEKISSVRKRLPRNGISIATVQQLDFEDEFVIDNLVRAVEATETEQMVEQILSLLSDSEMSSNASKLKNGLRKMLRGSNSPKKPNQKKQVHLPSGIIRLLKAKISVDEKKSAFEKISNKLNEIDTFNGFEDVPREGRFTNDNFPDENGITTQKKHDFSSCEVQTDGSCCITKMHDKELLEKEDIKECWHKNVTSCYDSYVTEFTSAEEEECEDVFYKSCVIDFKQVPFDYDIKSCHTPMIKECDDRLVGKEICKEFSETMCNTTYDDQWKPQTSCSKHPKQICAPDTCQVVQGEEKCTTKTLSSTSYKPVETCDLQPQIHCTIVTKPVPQLKVVPNCFTEEKEICKRKQGKAKPVGKKTIVKWCKRDDKPTEPLPRYGFSLPGPKDQ